MQKLILSILLVLGTHQLSAQYSGRALSNGQQDSTQVKKLNEVVVTAKKYSQFELVGENNQPAWTLVRKFPSTRTYIMVPKGTVMYEK